MKIIKTLTSSMCLFVLISTGFIFANENSETNNKDDQNKTQLPLTELQTFSEVFQHIKLSYHQDISDQELINAAISGMLNQLGDYTRYYSRQELSQFNSAAEGNNGSRSKLSISTEYLGSKIAYLSISHFTKTTPQEINNQLIRLIKTNQTNKLIIDLRNNLGGVLDAGVEAADLFLKKGTIYSSTGKTKESKRLIKASKTTPFKQLSIVIMINKNTASSSEIFTAALQENKRALVLGEKSFGKGTIQTIFSMRSGAGVKITTSEYFTPSGNKIQSIGVIPDIKFDTDSLSNKLGKPLFDDLQIYQAYLMFQSPNEELKSN